MHQHQNPPRLRRSFSQNLEPLATHRRLEIREAGDPAARTGQIFNKTASDRIGDQREYNRHRAADGLQYGNGRVADGGDHIRLCRYQLLGLTAHVRDIAIPDTDLKADVASFHPAEFCKALLISGQQLAYLLRRPPYPDNPQTRLGARLPWNRDRA